MRNIYPDLMIKMLAGSKKKSIYFFPDFSWMHTRRMCLHTRSFLLVEIADRFLGQALYG